MSLADPLCLLAAAVAMRLLATAAAHYRQLSDPATHTHGSSSSGVPAALLQVVQELQASLAAVQSTEGLDTQSGA
jgi:uncharacterized membrane protein required for colicin V production